MSILEVVSLTGLETPRSHAAGVCLYLTPGAQAAWLWLSLVAREGRADLVLVLRLGSVCAQASLGGEVLQPVAALPGDGRAPVHSDRPWTSAPASDAGHDPMFMFIPGWPHEVLPR